MSLIICRVLRGILVCVRYGFYELWYEVIRIGFFILLWSRQSSHFHFRFNSIWCAEWKAEVALPFILYHVFVKLVYLIQFIRISKLRCCLYGILKRNFYSNEWANIFVSIFNFCNQLSASILHTSYLVFKAIYNVLANCSLLLLITSSHLKISSLIILLIFSSKFVKKKLF